MRAHRLERKQRAARRGRIAERLVSLWLTLKGYRVLARNLRTHLGEIDIVARRGSTLVAIEVKARSALSAEAILPRQRARIERALVAFQSARPELQHCRLRFDAVCIEGFALPRHIVDAWRPL